jgi:hypothetical protein
MTSPALPFPPVNGYFFNCLFYPGREAATPIYIFFLKPLLGFTAIPVTVMAAILTGSRFLF